VKDSAYFLDSSGKKHPPDECPNLPKRKVHDKRPVENVRKNPSLKKPKKPQKSTPDLRPSTPEARNSKVRRAKTPCFPAANMAKRKTEKGGGISSSRAEKTR